jgi:glycosyltransferase involved in cell wall biosynthesis
MTAVDIIVPCYNYGRFLGRCVGSLLVQEGCDVRVLVIDDCSTDDSLATAQAIAATDPRVHLVAHPQNRGHIATYNEGIDWIEAPFMLLLSADDVLAPGALARATRLMEDDPSLAFVYGKAVKFTDEAVIAAEPTADPAAAVCHRSGRDFIASICGKPENPVETATVIVRSAIQKRVGGYRPELPHSGDLEMWLRLAVHGDVAEVEAVQAFTRIHAHNMRHGYSTERMLGDYRQRIEAFRLFFERGADGLADVAALEALARRGLSSELLWAAIRTFEEGAPREAEAMRNLAVAAFPPVTSSSLWWRLRVRELLGRRVWGAVDGMRRLRPSGGAP